MQTHRNGAGLSSVSSSSLSSSSLGGECTAARTGASSGSFEVTQFTQ